MSWDAYIQSLTGADKEGNSYVEEAAICGLETKSLWANSANMNITPAEIQKLLGDRKDFGQCGTTICGTKCRMLRDNLDTDGMNSLDLKTAPDTEGNTYNICIGKTGKTLVIAKGKKDANGGQVATKVFETVSHLKKAQF